MTTNDTKLPDGISNGIKSLVIDVATPHEKIVRAKTVDCARIFHFLCLFLLIQISNGCASGAVKQWNYNLKHAMDGLNEPGNQEEIKKWYFILIPNPYAMDSLKPALKL